MFHFLKSLFKPILQPLNEILISRSAILHNLKVIQNLHPWESIFPVLKSNAYGHGIKEIATILRDTNVPYLCVDSFPEYQIVRDYAKKKSLVLGETLPENYLAYNPHRATLCIYNYETIDFLGKTWKKRTLHLFLNTGMNREGIQEQNLPKILALLEQYPNLMVEWIMSHFANADEVDDSMDWKQIETFKNMLNIIRKSEIRNPKSYIHIANSAGTVKYTGEQIWCNARRTGLALYGYNPLPIANSWQLVATSQQLIPALTLTSTVIATQQLKTGDIVSYGSKRTAKQPCYTATLPLWYYEGLPRNMTNTRSFHYEGVQHPQAGTICMNLSCYSTGPVKFPIGTKVTLIKHKPQTINSISHAITSNLQYEVWSLESLSSLSSTIPYEILTRLNASIRRTIVA